MAMNLGNREGPMMYINVTPMIDVLLVLLIIFMIITPMVPVGLPAIIPQPAPLSARQQVNQSSVVITVHRDGCSVRTVRP